MQQPPPDEIVKVYPERGAMQQFRLQASVPFSCFRCNEVKKSKLVVLHKGKWDRIICNGCYGRLLSIFDVKAGTKPDDEKAADLSELLLSLLSKSESLEAEKRFKVSENRADRLSGIALKFVSTAEHLANALSATEDLDWSPVIIGLCKAVEIEVIERIVMPLAKANFGGISDSDMRDKDIGRVAKFCNNPTGKPPELGTFGHFLQTALNSETRRTSSNLIGGMFRLFGRWPQSSWLSSLTGFHPSLVRLTRDFRNRAAHIDSLTKADYEQCRDFVLGKDGMLWQLILSTEPNPR